MHLFLAIWNLPATYIRPFIESSPNDQIQKLFVSIKHTNTYISFYNFILNRLILIEFHSKHFHFHDDGMIFHSNQKSPVWERTQQQLLTLAEATE